MSSTRVLVVYYSRSGTTRDVARSIAKTLDADVEEIRDRRNRDGLVGYARSLMDAALHLPAYLEPQRRDPSDYDLVLVGTPVWASRVSAPVRVYLEANRRRLPKVAFFVTEGGRGAERVLSEMTAIAGKEPLATLVLKQRDVARALVPTNVFLTKLGGGADGRIPLSVVSARPAQ